MSKVINSTQNIIPMINDEGIEGLRVFFESKNLPKELQFNAAIEYNDLPEFIKTNLELLKSGVLKGLAAKVRFDDLVAIRDILSGPTDPA